MLRGSDESGDGGALELPSACFLDHPHHVIGFHSLTHRTLNREVGDVSALFPGKNLRLTLRKQPGEDADHVVVILRVCRCRVDSRFFAVTPDFTLFQFFF